MRVAITLSALMLGACPAPGFAQEPADTNYDESQVRAYELPDPLVSIAGQPVEDAQTWRVERRPEILRVFASEVYGRVPKMNSELRFETLATDKEALGGLATRKEIRIHLFAAEQAPWIDLLLFLPNGVQRPAPAFLALNYGNQGVHIDPAILPSRNAHCSRGEHAHRWPLATILKRGYAVVSFHGGDIELDRHGSGCRFSIKGWQKGIRHLVASKSAGGTVAADEWGSISAWAWGLSRVLDYLESEASVDARKVAVFGHSRTGKTALWAGALDERFGLVISNNSGQGGAALGRRRYGESIKASFDTSGIWYCKNYGRYGHKESTLPVDAHLLIAAIAPRPVYVASAEQDRWADPKGEFLAAMHAGPVYQLLGKQGVGVSELPALNTPVGDSVGYHIRSGDHEITAYDWGCFLDFADRHFGVESGER